MKKWVSMVLACVMAIGMTAAAVPARAEEAAVPEELIAAAKEEGSLVVYGSCEEDYLRAACDNFEKLYDIEVT